MCGIFGSTERERFETLYHLNRDRGAFSLGILSVHKDNSDYISLQRYRGEYPNLGGMLSPEYRLFLGHTQAPTSAKRDWDASTTHPFEAGNWIVAHNGIITNFEELKQKYVDHHTNPVDSSIIPALLNRFEQQGIKGHINLVVKLVAEELKGTFACWIYNTKCGKVFLIRCASTLFADNEGNFSSTVFPNSREVSEGVVYEVTSCGLIAGPAFKFNSPFFVV